MLHPKNVQNPVVNLLIVGQPAQSASEKPQRSSVVSPVKCKLKLIDPLTYRKIRRTIFMLVIDGVYIN